MKPKSLSKKETYIFLGTVIPYCLIIYLLLFGWVIFNSVSLFARVFLYNSFYYYIVYSIYSLIASVVRSKYASDNLLFKRIGAMLVVFYPMNFLVLSTLYKIHSTFALLEIPIQSHMFWWVYLTSCVGSTFITFFTEGVENWEKWKTSIRETERLRNAYKYSRILGLKGQINSHFLFNCFNTLSELITEDEHKAERFLEEMASVHRHLLKGSNEYLVSIEDEMQFVESYLYLIKVRFGTAISVNVSNYHIAANLKVPPLSMHVILENIIYTNAIEKRNPLLILIESTDNSLAITHTIHKRTTTQNFDVNEGLDNLISKYRLLNAPPITMEENGEKRIIKLPLLDSKLSVA